MDPSTLTAWSYYFSAIASADATLTGLIFVAVSINLTKILATPGLTGRVAEPMIQLFGVLAISTTCLIPGLRPHTLGLLILILTIFIWAFQMLHPGDLHRGQNRKPALLARHPGAADASGVHPVVRFRSFAAARRFVRPVLGRRRIRAGSGRGRRKRLGPADRNSALAARATRSAPEYRSRFHSPEWSAGRSRNARY